MIDNFHSSVEGNSLKITFTSLERSEIKIKDLSQDNYRVAIDNNQYEILLDTKNFNIEDNLILVNDTVLTLEKYKLDLSKVNDDFYMTERLINASSRNLTPDELFLICFSYLEKIPSTCSYLGAIITLLSYRVLDDIDNRSFIFEKLLEAKKNYDKNFDNNNPHGIRWFISSASNFSMLCLTLGEVEQAEHCLNTLEKNASLVELNPLSYWNYSQAMTLFGLIQVNKGNYKKAGNIFLRNFTFTRNSLCDLYHPKNDWLMGQLSDCTALLELGKLNLIAGTNAYENKIPQSSRFSNFNSIGKEINIKPLFIRFNKLNPAKIKFFQETIRKFN